MEQDHGALPRDCDAPSKLRLACWRVVGALRNITGFTGSDFACDAVMPHISPDFTESQISESVMCVQSGPGCVQVAAAFYHKWLIHAHVLLMCSHAHSSHATARSECRSQAADSFNFGFGFALVITSEAVGMRVFHGFPISGLGQYVNLRSFEQDLPISHTG